MTHYTKKTKPLNKNYPQYFRKTKYLLNILFEKNAITKHMMTINKKNTIYIWILIKMIIETNDN